jgi:hypothetical protein
MSLNTPVVFIIYNRPKLTQEVFESIKKVKPDKLFVIADGPKGSIDEVKCNQARKVVDDTDWDCNVHTNYSDVNLGCRERVSTGLNWVFSNVEKAIILEDDCLPSYSFFYYCAELLNRFEKDSRIMHISGNNFLFTEKYKNKYDYYFSNYSLIWGWASWARVWEKYDVNMSSWPKLENTDWLIKKLGNKSIENFWKDIFNDTYNQRIDTWDYQLQFSIWLNNGSALTPSVNLVRNIGINENALHTSNMSDVIRELEAGEIEFPLTHNKNIVVDSDADLQTFKTILAPGVISEKANIRKRTQIKLGSILKNLY